MQSALTDINVSLHLWQLHFHHNGEVCREMSTLVRAVRLLGEIGGLKLSVGVDDNVSGGKDKVVTLVAVIVGEVKVVLRSVLCAFNGSFRVAVVVFSSNPIVRSFPCIDTQIACDEARKPLSINLFYSCPKASRGTVSDRNICGETDVEDVESLSFLSESCPRTSAAFWHIANDAASVKLERSVVKDAFRSIVTRHTSFQERELGLCI